MEHSNNGHTDYAPPHDLNAERAALGAALLADKTAKQVATEIDPEDFYNPTHRLLAHAIHDLYKKNSGIDPVTVTSYLKEKNQLHELRDGAAYLIKLAANTPVISHIDHYLDSVRKTAKARRIGHLAEELKAAAFIRDQETLPRLHQRLQIEFQASLSDRLLTEEPLAATMRGEDIGIKPFLLKRTDDTCLLYPGLLHWLASPPGRGKTFLALYCVAQAVKQKFNVVYLDWEGNRRVVSERLLALGVTAEEAQEFIFYARPGSFDSPKASALGQVIEQTNTVLTVCDGVAKAMAVNGMKENDNTDVLRWLSLVVDPIIENGSAALMLDHIVKNPDGNDLWPRAGGAKLGEVSGAAWTLRTVEPFSRNQPGRVDMIQAKDREGYNAVDGDPVAIIKFYPHNERLHIRLDPPIGQTEEGFKEYTYYMDQVSRHLELEPKGRTLTQLSADLGLNNKYLTESLGALESEGYIQSKGKDRRSTYFHLRPYRLEGAQEEEPELAF